MSKKPVDPATVIANAELTDVRLIGAEIRSGIRSPEEVKEALVRFSHKARVMRPLKEGGFAVSTQATVAIVPRDSQAAPVVVVKVEYELSYSVPDGFDADPGAIKTFASVNSVFQVWPYWREFVQNAFLRMELPPVILPVFRLPRRQPESKGAVDQVRAERKKVPARTGRKRVRAKAQ